MSFFRYADVRASDAEREATVAFLGRHCAEGRLSPTELSDRVERTYAAVALSELDAVTRDLPRYPALAVRPSSRVRRRRLRRLAGAIAVTTLAALAVAHGLPAEAWAPVVLIVLPLAWTMALTLMPFALPLLGIALAFRSLIRATEPPEPDRVAPWLPNPSTSGKLRADDAERARCSG